jgi:hypothetical protein
LVSTVKDEHASAGAESMSNLTAVTSLNLYHFL